MLTAQNVNKFSSSNKCRQRRWQWQRQRCKVTLRQTARFVPLTYFKTTDNQQPTQAQSSPSLSVAVPHFVHAMWSVDKKKIKKNTYWKNLGKNAKNDADCDSSLPLHFDYKNVYAGDTLFPESLGSIILKPLILHHYLIKLIRLSHNSETMLSISIWLQRNVAMLPRTRSNLGY